jgi:endo-1,4-beta-xylanase
MLKVMSVSPSLRSLFVLTCVLASCNSSEPIDPGIVENGLRAKYFNNNNLSGDAVVTKVESNINFDWGTGSPEGVNTNNFSALFEGSLTPKYTELYTFTTEADEGLRVWVNGVKLIDRWAFHKFTDYSKLKLEAGKKYAIRIEYNEVSDGAKLQLAWESLSQAKEIIATEALSTDDGLAEGLPANAPLRVLADARGIKIGAAIKQAPYNESAAYREILNREFNHAQPEGDCMAVVTHNGADPMKLNLNSSGRLESFDTLLDIAQTNKQSVQCFHLLWYREAQWGSWLNALSVEDRRAFIKTRIKDMMTRYAGRVEGWNVVNEAFTDEINGVVSTRPREVTNDGSTFVNWLYDLGTGTEYIAEAFKAARAADPTAKLFYNDYGIEKGAPEGNDLSKPTSNKKWNAVLDMVRDFKTREVPVPIDGVGFQSHIWLGDWAKVESNIINEARNLNLHFRQLHAIDPKLEARITEFDNDTRSLSTLSNEARFGMQAKFYGEMAKACLTAPNCTSFSMWGISDKYTWLSEPQFGGSLESKPLMFDSNMQPKAAYYAVRDALRGI